MEIKKNTKNELFKRQEISFLVEAEKNPSFDEMKKQIAEELKKPEENIDIQTIKGKFGRNTFLIKAYVYDSKEDLEKMLELRKTQKHKKAEAEEKKKAVEEAKKKEAEEKPAEAKA